MQSLVWVPKERAGEILRGSPSQFPQGALGLLNAVAAQQQHHEQQKAAAAAAAVLRDSPGLVFSLSADAKGFLQAQTPPERGGGGEEERGRGGGGRRGGERGEKGGGGGNEVKSSKEESQSLLRVSGTLVSPCLTFLFFLCSPSPLSFICFSLSTHLSL